jgi:hypothetical protein
LVLERGHSASSSLYKLNDSVSTCFKTALNLAEVSRKAKAPIGYRDSLQANTECAPPLQTLDDDGDAVRMSKF